MSDAPTDLLPRVDPRPPRWPEVDPVLSPRATAPRLSDDPWLDLLRRVLAGLRALDRGDER